MHIEAQRAVNPVRSTFFFLPVSQTFSDFFSTENKIIIEFMMTFTSKTVQNLRSQKMPIQVIFDEILRILSAAGKGLRAAEGN